MTEYEHTGLVDCCVCCTVDDLWRLEDERRAQRQRIKAERGPELDEFWLDLGGEA